VLNPQDFGVLPLKAEQIAGGDTVESSAKIFMNVIQNKGTEAQTNVVCANAGMAIATAQNLSPIEGFEKAKESLQSGKALTALTSLQNISKA
jgi:anthranilate phosphoribosyltransferase